MSGRPPITSAPTPGSPAYVPVAVVCAVAHLAMGGVFLVSGLVVPWYVLPPLFAWWVVLSLVGVRLVRQRSWWIAAIPVVAALSWIVVLTVGEAAFDWTA